MHLDLGSSVVTQETKYVQLAWIHNFKQCTAFFNVIFFKKKKAKNMHSQYYLED